MADKPRFEGEPTANWLAIETRARVLQQIRDFFGQRGVVEVETPLLSHDTVVDRHLDPIPVRLGEDACWLQTSPEFAMKRLLASHQRSIFQICKAFRRGEQGHSHNPEFTMVEWYVVGHDLIAGINLLGELAGELFGTPGCARLSYREAFEHEFDINPHAASVQQLRECGRRTATAPPDNLDRDGWLEFLWSIAIQPKLGADVPTIVDGYPASQAALAQVSQSLAGDWVAERFELFFQGCELANGYHELLDSAELQRRTVENNHQRVADGNESLPTKSRLTEAMKSGLPGCAGVALGLDRVLMILLQAQSIEDVIAFPFDIA